MARSLPRRVGMGSTTYGSGGHLVRRPLLVARSRPRLPFPKLQLAGSLLEIGPTDLVMDRAEALRLIAATGLSTLPPGTAEAIHAAAGGWIAGILLCALHVRSSLEPDRASATLGDNLQLHEYLNQEVLEGLPAGSRRTLLDRARRLAREGTPGDRRDALLAHEAFLRSILLRLEGNTEASLEIAASAFQECRDRKPFLATSLRVQMAVGRFLSGDLERARAELEDSMVRAEAAEHHLAYFGAGYTLAEILTLRGRVELRTRRPRRDRGALGGSGRRGPRPGRSRSRRAADPHALGHRLRRPRGQADAPVAAAPAGIGAARLVGPHPPPARTPRPAAMGCVPDRRAPAHVPGTGRRSAGPLQGLASVPGGRRVDASIARNRVRDGPGLAVPGPTIRRGRPPGRLAAPGREFGDVLVAGEIDFPSGFQPTYLYGVGTDWKIPGAAFFMVNFFVRDEVATKGISFQVNPAWLFPFEFGPVKGSFGGWIDIMTGEGDDQEMWWQMQPTLMLDVGNFWGAPGKLETGIEYEYFKDFQGVKDWVKNKPQFVLKWNL